jgi:AraC-like DNA-binding protein
MPPRINGIVRPWEIGRTFDFQVVAPSKELARLVDQHWVVRWDLGERSFVQEVLPHPSQNMVVEPSGAFVWGVPTARGRRVLTGAGWAVGTKLRPGAFTACTGVPADELTNGRRSVRDVFGVALPPEPDPRASIAATEEILSRYAAVEDPAFDRVSEIVQRMRELAPDARVEEIAQAHHYAPRSLQRLFQRYVGVGPKWVLKRLRIHEAVTRLADRDAPAAASLALDLGYYDQAHFIRDFRAIVGRSPAEYAAEATRRS